MTPGDGSLNDGGGEGGWEMNKLSMTETTPAANSLQDEWVIIIIYNKMKW